MDPGVTQSTVPSPRDVRAAAAAPAPASTPAPTTATPVDVVTASRQRRAHQALVLAGVAAAIASVVLALAGSPHAMTAGACLAGILAADAVLGVARRRAWRLARAAGDPDASSRARRVGMRVGVRIVVAIFLAAALVAAIGLGSERFLLGTSIAVLALALVGAPAWLAATGDEEAAAG